MELWLFKKNFLLVRGVQKKSLQQRTQKCSVELKCVRRTSRNEADGTSDEENVTLHSLRVSRFNRNTRYHKSWKEFRMQ